MKEPKISVAWEENIYLTVVPATQQPSSNTAAVWQKPFSPASRGLLLLIAGQPTCLHHALGFQLARVSTPTQNSQVPSLAVTQICCDWVKLALYLQRQTMACLTTAKQQVLQSTTFHSGWLKTILTCFLGTSASDCRAAHLSSTSYLRVSKPGYGLPHNS